jgi:hypothetical protein
MADAEPRDSIDTKAPNYRAYACSLHRAAERARFPEAKDTLNRVACWYEVPAKYVEHRRNPLAS